MVVNYPWLDVNLYVKTVQQLSIETENVPEWITFLREKYSDVDSWLLSMRYNKKFDFYYARPLLLYILASLFSIRIGKVALHRVSLMRFAKAIRCQRLDREIRVMARWFGLITQVEIDALYRLDRWRVSKNVTLFSLHGMVLGKPFAEFDEQDRAYAKRFGVPFYSAELLNKLNKRLGYQPLYDRPRNAWSRLIADWRIGDKARLYYDRLVDNGVKRRYMSSIARSLEHLIIFLDTHEHVDWSDMTQSDWRKYFDYLDENHSHNTSCICISAAKRFIKFCCDQISIPSNGVTQTELTTISNSHRRTHCSSMEPSEHMQISSVEADRLYEYTRTYAFGEVEMLSCFLLLLRFSTSWSINSLLNLEFENVVPIQDQGNPGQYIWGKSQLPITHWYGLYAIYCLVRRGCSQMIPKVHNRVNGDDMVHLFGFECLVRGEWVLQKSHLRKLQSKLWQVRLCP